MATPRNGEPLRIIGSISKFAGTLVGNAVITGKRIIHSTISSGERPSDKPEEKTSPAQSQRKKKAVRKTKKKKVVRRKSTGSSDKGGASKKKSIQSPAKKKKGATHRKKKTRRKTKKTAMNEMSIHSQAGLISESDAGTNTPIEKQEPQLKLLIAEAEMADKKYSNVNGSFEEGTEKKGTAELRKPSIPIIEYKYKANKAVVPATSVL
ncbi:MAG: hypothetical protein ACYSSI_07110 [Planctomycetota bacterium]|jgi:hypothetical protein